MATSTTKTTSETATEIPAIAQKFREQLVSAVQQSQQLSLDATQNWVKAVSVLPAMDLPMVPGFSAMPAMPGIEAATRFTFDVAADLLSAQREFALQLVHALVPAKTI